MISDNELLLMEISALGSIPDVNRLISEIRRLREQLKPDCVNGCIFKLARKIVEEGK